MREVARANELTALDFGVASDFFDFHLFAGGSAESAVKMQVCDYSDLGVLPNSKPVLRLLVVVWLSLKTYHEFASSHALKKEKKALHLWLLWRELVQSFGDDSVLPSALPLYDDLLRPNFRYERDVLCRDSENRGGNDGVINGHVPPVA